MSFGAFGTIPRLLPDADLAGFLGIRPSSTARSSIALRTWYACFFRAGLSGRVSARLFLETPRVDADSARGAVVRLATHPFTSE